MKPVPKLPLAEALMTDFARQPGLAETIATERRYLWTDAFAVCNFLEIHHLRNDERYRSLARRLIDHVHRTLGRHREDDRRTGWLSGLDEETGKSHPTLRGLRIGKKLNERGPHGPYEEALEWDRDGQYFHYLTKWMHALNRAGSATGDPTYRRWAIELAKTACTRSWGDVCFKRLSATGWPFASWGSPSGCMLWTDCSMSWLPTLVHSSVNSLRGSVWTT